MRVESWVTVCESDAEGWGATVLARSIRKTLTNKNLAVAVSENVSRPIRDLLHRLYDSVFRFDSADVGGKSRGKLWIWNLRANAKCVYLDPFSIMLENSDDLFKKSAFSAPLLMPGHNSFSTSAFVFKPNLETFEGLLDVGNQIKGDVGEILNNVFQHVVTKAKFQISNTYVTTIMESDLEYSNKDSKIYGFEVLPCTLKTNRKILQDLLFSWVSTFVHEVIPEIGRIKTMEARNRLYDSMETFGLPSTNGPEKPNFVDENIGDLDDAIAVVGMSCRFAGANNTDEFWKNLVEGVDGICSFPADRPNAYPNIAHDSRFLAGFLKCPVDEFDAKFFGISPREAPFVDPQQRLLLEVIWESLENANISPQNLKGSDTGVFLGIWQQDYDRTLPIFGLTQNDFHHRYLGNAFSATASRISYFLGLYGPNYSIESGCSSSSSGIHLAVQSLRRGETSLAIASGVNLVLALINPLGGGDKETDSLVFAKDCRCKTFDESADGFARAEGCGSVVLKRYVDALRDGENILGIIRGTALNNDGPGTSFGTPNGYAQARVFKEALVDARVEPREVSFVEAHGTGTIVGDPTEMWAIGEVYSSERVDPLWVSSVKTNIGHAEACAGMAGLIKVLLCLKHNTLPPHLHLKNINPRIDLEKIPARIPMEATPWTAEPKIAAVSSFSMSGTNVHIIVQKAPKRNEMQRILPRTESVQMIGLSAKTEEALEAMANNLLSWLEQNKNTTLQDIAYSLNTGRANMSHRIGVVAKDTAQFLTKLEKRTYVIGKAPIQKPKIVFLFTGQGSQYFGMAKNIYSISMPFRSAFGECDHLFRFHFGVTLKEVLWKDSQLLEKTIYCQPAIFCLEYSLLRFWNSFGIFPDFVLGHSVGEFCAAVAAGVLSLADAMKLVVGRSKLVESLPDGSMLAVKASFTQTSQLIHDFSQKFDGGWLDVAATNSAEETVVSGLPEAIKQFSEFAPTEGVKTQHVNASHGFHSRQMDPVLDEFGKIASEVSIRKPTSTYISATLAREMAEEDFSSSYWVRHLRDKVRFQEAFQRVWDGEGRVLLEIGAQPILLSLAMGNVKDTSLGTFCPSLRKIEDDESSILTSLSKLFVGGVNMSWKNWFGQEAKKVVLPTYPFQRQKFWFSQEEGSELCHFLPSAPLLHPLLGRKVASPLRDHTFSNVFRRKELGYVEDHKVGERVILPAAAYLECIMAAGCEVLQGGRVQIPFSVEDFQVEAALELEKPASIQTVLSSSGGEEGVAFCIGLHKQVSKDQADHWKRHACGTFRPATRAVFPPVDLRELQGRMEEKDGMGRVYERIAKVGICFGPKFQSIQKAWKGEAELLTQTAVPDGSEEYICHPILLDAMIQTFAFRFALTSNQSEAEAELQLPISIRSFTWLSRELSTELFIYTNWKEEGASVVLYGSEGEALAVMEGIELIKTNVAAFLRILNTETNTLPAFMEEVWRPTIGVTRTRLDTIQLVNEYSTDSTASLEEKNKTFNEDILQLFEKMSFLYLARSIQECHWPWKEIGEKLNVFEWARLAPSSIRICQTDSFHRVFENFGYLRGSEESGSYEILLKLPTPEEIEIELLSAGKQVAETYGEDDIHLLFVKRCGCHLTSVLQGKMTPLAYMFPDASNEIGAIRFYSESLSYTSMSALGTSALRECLKNVSSSGGVVRILEVGGGSGITAMQTFNHLSELGIQFHYMFTDISPVFLQEAKKKFPKNVTYGILNIEEDPLTQGFAPAQFDIILASCVIHATRDIVESLKNLNCLLRDNGILIGVENFTDLVHITISFGFLDGWWRFKDFRTYSPLVHQDKWEKCFDEAGFYEYHVLEICNKRSGAIVGRKKTMVIDLSPEVENNEKSWVAISDGTELVKMLQEKFSCYNRKIFCSEINETFVLPLNLEGILFFWTNTKDPSTADYDSCMKLLNLLQNLMKTYAESKDKPRLYVITCGVNYIGDASVGNPNAALVHSMLKSFCNETADFTVIVIDTDQDEIFPKREAEEVFAQLWKKDGEMFNAVRGDRIFVQRLIGCDHRQKASLPMPNSNRFAVLNPPSKNFADLEITVAPRTEVTEDKIEIAVRACALNFRDIFMVLQPEGFEIPSYMEKDAGLDIAGVVTAVGPNVTKWTVGDAVFGFTSSGGLGSHVVVSEKAVMRKPEKMTFTSASTIPCAFLTVFYSLIECAKMQKGERVLIHVATGGVGMAAIQVANEYGAEIYATAGSKRKRAYLRSIGIRYVYHSRNTDFGEEILRDTNGAGVNIVLNSLTGPNFKESSLCACAQEARFVEIGKMNIWTTQEVQALRPDVKYFIVDLADMAYKQPEELMHHTHDIDKEFRAGIYEGLPHDTFPLDLLREAFHYFQEAKHIGKIVVRIPEGKVSPDGRLTFSHLLFHSESTYLVTGGLGGLGLEVTNWMTQKGAINIVLTSRSAPTTQAAQLIQKLKNDGYQIVVIQGDVAEIDNCRKLLAIIKDLNLPPLRGIMHAAGVLSDGIISNQTQETYDYVLRPKVKGAVNLHDLTKGYELEFFSMYSSISAIIGMPGQSNHASANRFMDSFAHYRIAQGLHANSINFGPWSDVGAASKLKLNADVAVGIRMFTPAQGLASMEKIFRERASQRAVWDVNDWNLVRQISRLGKYLDEMRGAENNESGGMEEYKVIIEEIKAAPPEERQAKIEDFMEKVLKQTLRIPDNESLDRDQNFSEIGVDSLMAMELRNKLQGMLGDKQLTLSSVQENRTIRSLSRHMAALMNEDSDAVVDMDALLAKDSILPAEIQAAEVTPKPYSDWSDILLTGATGHLGVHFIDTILKKNPNFILHCAIRGVDEEDVISRLHKKLERYNLFDKVDMSRLRIFVADLSKENFGMSPEAYLSLAESIDAIVHCAVKTNHIDSYIDGKENSMRHHNVFGSTNILKFAGTAKTKHVLYASSLLAVTGANDDGTLSEVFPKADETAAVKNGYALSKYICEKLIGQANERGIPCTAIRYASIVGDSVRGVMPPGYNHAWNIMLTCIRVRSFPRTDKNGIPIMAVDTAANISTQIFFSSEKEGGVYNLTSGTFASEDDIREVFRDFGVEGEFISPKEWRDLVFEESGLDENLLKPLLPIYATDEKTQTHNILSLHPMVSSIPNLEVIKLSNKVIRNCPGIQEEIVPAKVLIRRHLQAHYDSLREQS